MTVFADVAGADIDWATPFLLVFFGLPTGWVLALSALVVGARGKRGTRGGLWAVGAASLLLNLCMSGYFALATYERWWMIPACAAAVTLAGLLLHFMISRRAEPTAEP